MLSVVGKIMNIANVNNIFGKPLIFICYIFGVSPFNSRCINTVYAIALLVISIGHLMSTPIAIVEVDNFYRNTTINVESFLQFFTLQRMITAAFPVALICVNLCSKLTELFLKKTYMPSIFTRFGNVDLVLKQSDKRGHLYEMRPSISVFLIGYAPILAELFICFKLINDTETSTKLLLWYAVLFFGNTSSCCTEMQFISICYALESRYASIVDELFKLVDTTDSFIMQQLNDCYQNDNSTNTSSNRAITLLEENTPSVNSISIENRLRSYRHFKEALRNTKYGMKFSTANPQFFNKVKLLHTVYRNLCRITENVGTLYQMQLLVSISALFFIALLNIYFLILSTGYGQLHRQDETNMFWIIHCLIRFLMLIGAAYSTTAMAKKAKPLVAAINNRFLDNECKEELLLFYNYMMSCKVEFTAYGFFTLNTRLITSAIGAGTTYLVILVQFHAN